MAKSAPRPVMRLSPMLPAAFGYNAREVMHYTGYGRFRWLKSPGAASSGGMVKIIPGQFIGASALIPSRLRMNIREILPLGGSMARSSHR